MAAAAAVSPTSSRPSSSDSNNDDQSVFLTADYPLGFAGGDTNLNRYCGNAPTDHVDPTGLADGDGSLALQTALLSGRMTSSQVDRLIGLNKARHVRLFAGAGFDEPGAINGLDDLVSQVWSQLGLNPGDYYDEGCLIDDGEGNSVLSDVLSDPKTSLGVLEIQTHGSPRTVWLSPSNGNWNPSGSNPTAVSRDNATYVGQTLCGLPWYQGDGDNSGGGDSSGVNCVVLRACNAGNYWRTGVNSVPQLLADMLHVPVIAPGGYHDERTGRIQDTNLTGEHLDVNAFRYPNLPPPNPSKNDTYYVFNSRLP